MKKSELKPGMEVRNKMTGSIGEVRGNPDGILLRSHDDYVRVWRFIKRGKKKWGRESCTWDVNNLEFTA
ncbi:MAG: hypothetical protein Q8M83_05665 [bacterium]|nr:hypothetical protein [bacterium]